MNTAFMSRALVACLIMIMATIANAAQDNPTKTTASKEAANAPMPALYPVPLADKALLLDITKAGDHYVAVGAHGVILTSDDGKQWQQQPSPISTMLNAVAFANAKQGWAVGHTGVILHTKDGGKHWSIQARNTSGGHVFYAIHILDSSNLIVLGKGEALRTRDGGVHWVPMTSPVFQLKWNFNAITQLNNGCYMLVGERGLMARSCGGIDNWQQLKTPYAGSLYGVMPYKENGAIIYGMRGHVYLTTDVKALQTTDSKKWSPYMVTTVTNPMDLLIMGWRQIKTPIDQSIYSGMINAKGQAIFAGSSGYIIAGNIQGKMRLLPNDSSDPITDFLRQGDHLITVGRDGTGWYRLNTSSD